MGWEAYAAKEGQSRSEYQGLTDDPPLQKIFFEASAEVKQLAGWIDGSFEEGSLDGWSRQLVLARATGVVCFDDNETGYITWSSEYVRQLQIKANWDIPREEEATDCYPDWYDNVDYWAARVFLQTCASHNLVMFLTW